MTRYECVVRIVTLSCRRTSRRGHHRSSAAPTRVVGYTATSAVTQPMRCCSRGKHRKEGRAPSAVRAQRGGGRREEAQDALRKEKRERREGERCASRRCLVLGAASACSSEPFLVPRRCKHPFGAQAPRGSAAARATRRHRVRGTSNTRVSGAFQRVGHRARSFVQ